ncbi:MAG: hypothetical protein U0457_14165 [Candidatus Sericytochromatia bacterium]
MADELNQETEEKKVTAPLPQIQEEDFSTDGSLTAATQDSLAINRARAAYGKKTPNSGLKERRTPQRVVTADYVQDEPYEADDIDDETIIAPEKQLINKTYKSSLELKEQKVYTNVAESASGNDTLALQNADSRSGQTISFKVKGIQWKAGYSQDFSKTPLGHAMHPIPLPPPTEERPDSLKKTGIVIRPVNPKLQKVLGQLMPAAFKKEMTKERGKKDRLKQLSVFYLPSPQSAFVGFIHEYIVPRTDGRDAFYLYIQTSVGKAPVAIVDEVLRTLEAGLPEGEKADIYDYTQQEEEDVIMPEPNYKIAEEVNEAMKQVSATFNDSIMVHSVKKSVSSARNHAVDFMRYFDKYLARGVRVLAAIVLMFMNSLPMRMMVSGLRFLTKWVVRTIWGVNKVLLAVARSPITVAVLDAIGKVMSLLGGVLGAGFNGLVYFFMIIGRFFASIYSSTSGMFSGQLSLSDLNFSLPSFGGGKRGGFFGLGGDSSEGGDGKKAPIKIRGDKKNLGKGTAKPQAKSTVSIQPTSKLKQVTKPAPPKVKGGAPAGISGAGVGGVGAGGSKGTGPVGGAPGNNPLGYFEDEPF